MSKCLPLVLCLSIFATEGRGQEVLSARPANLTGRNADTFRQALRKELPSKRFSLPDLPELRLQALSKGELEPKPEKLAAQAGVHRRRSDETEAFSRWAMTPGGTHVWRLRMQSPGAAGLRVHFTNFDAGNGRVWIHDGSGRENEIMGPYTSKGVFSDGDFWSDFVLSDTLVVEYEQSNPPDSPVAKPPFEIRAISHIVQGILPRQPEPQARLMGPGTPTLPSASFAPQAAATCHLDVSCYPEWAETAKAVGHIVYESEGRTYVCSGTLLADRARTATPYFLTADHCIANETEARTLQAFWFYQSSTCDGPPADRREVPRSLGATYLVSGGLAQGDFSLIKLTNVPDSVTFSGWDAEEKPLGTEFAGIHHPAGDYKRISFSQRVANRPGLTGTNPNFFYTVQGTRGRTEGGSSGSGLFTAPNVLVGTLSYGPKVDGPNEICMVEPFFHGYGRFATHYNTLRTYLEGRETPGTPPPAGGTGPELVPGQPAQFSFEPVTGATLFSGPNAFRVQVPAGATRLQIRLTTNGQVGFIVRHGQPPTVTGGQAVGDHTSPGYTGNETLVITPESSPALRVGTYYVAIAVFTTGQAISGTLVAELDTSGSNPNPPPGGGGTGRVLQSGVPANFSLDAVQNPTLFRGELGYRLEVPEGATRVEIQLATSTPNADVDLYVRHGQDVGLEDGRVTADHFSEGPDGRESIVITPTGNPRLRAGTYYIALAVLTRNIATSGTITATITGGTTPPPGNPPPGGGPPPTGSGTALTSGAAAPFQIQPVALPTLINGASGFYIQVPQGATRLNIRLATQTAGADVDLLVRRGSQPSAIGGRLEADFNSSGPDGNEQITITPSSSPALSPGTYYIALAVFTKNIAIAGTITATIDGAGGAPGGGQVLTPGTPANFTLPAVNSATLLTGAQAYTINVAAPATRLEIRLNTTNPAHDIDLFVRRGAPPEIVNGKVVADFSSTGPAGLETITISNSSQPAFQPGTYYVALGVFTTGVEISGTLNVTTDSSGTPPPGGGGSGAALTSGQPKSFSFDPVSTPMLFHGDFSFFVDVPAGATRLDIRLNTATAGADVDLYVRRGQDVELGDRQAIADFTSDGPTGSEEISISPTSSPALQPGRYYIAFGVFTTGKAIAGTVTATVVGSGGSAPPSTSTTLVPGQPAKFTLPSVDTGTLFTGEYAYKLEVPEGVSRVRIQLLAETPNTDIDLYVRRNQHVQLVDGQAVADHASETETGQESVVISGTSTPPLGPGTYYIAFGVFTRGVPVTATLTATVERDSVAPPLSSAVLLTPGTPARFELPAVDSATLFAGQSAFRVSVPTGSAQLEVRVQTDDQSHDVDLFLRYGRETVVQNGRPVSDSSSEGTTGWERVVILNPRAGEHFINLGLFTLGTRVPGTINVALVQGGTQSEELTKLSHIDKNESPEIAPLRAGADAIEPKPPVSRLYRLGEKSELQRTSVKGGLNEPGAVLRLGAKQLETIVR